MNKKKELDAPEKLKLMITIVNRKRLIYIHQYLNRLTLYQVI